MNAFRQARWLLAWRYFCTNMVVVLLFSCFVALGYRWSEMQELRQLLVRQAEWLVHSPNLPEDSEGMLEELEEISVSSKHPIGFIITRPDARPASRFGLLSAHIAPSEIDSRPYDEIFKLNLQQEPCLAIVTTIASPHWSRAMIAISMKNMHQSMHSLLLILVIGSIITALLLFFLGLQLSAQVLLPVQLSYRQMQKSLADTSHELRTPLTAIMGEAEVALRHPREPQAYREALSYCAAYSRQMLAVVEGVLELSRADAEIPIVDTQWVDLGQLATSEVEQLCRQMTKALRVEVVAAENVVVEGDSELLTRALRNVLDNAIRHTPLGGRVEVVVSRSRDQKSAILSVADNGSGIAADDLPFVFDRFFQGSNAVGTTKGGTGLGLAIVKALVEAHHGSVHLTSHLGTGTTLTIKLPLIAIPETV